MFQKRDIPNRLSRASEKISGLEATMRAIAPNSHMAPECKMYGLPKDAAVNVVNPKIMVTLRRWWLRC